MSEPLDLHRLRDIPDPFPGAAAPAPRPPTLPASSPTRSGVRSARVLFALAAVAYEAAWLIFLRAQVVAHSAWTVVLGVALPLVAGGAAGAVALRPGARGMGEPAPRLAAWVLVVPAALAAGVFLGSPPEPTDGTFWPRALGCIVTGAWLLAGPLLLLGLAFRRAFASASAWRTAALAIASGGLAMATLGVLCPHHTGAHLVVGHGAAMVLAAVAGALVGRRVVLA
jgi:Negative regulator of sigma F